MVPDWDPPGVLNCVTSLMSYFFPPVSLLPYIPIWAVSLTTGAFPKIDLTSCFTRISIFSKLVKLKCLLFSFFFPFFFNVALHNALHNTLVAEKRRRPGSSSLFF